MVTVRATGCPNHGRGPLTSISAIPSSPGRTVSVSGCAEQSSTRVSSTAVIV